VREFNGWSLQRTRKRAGPGEGRDRIGPGNSVGGVCGVKRRQPPDHIGWNGEACSTDGSNKHDGAIHDAHSHQGPSADGRQGPAFGVGSAPRFDSGAALNRPTAEDIGAQSRPGYKALDDCRRREIGPGQGLAKTHARLAKLDAFELDIAYPEFDADKIVEPNASGDEVAVADCPIEFALILSDKRFDLFGFDQGDVLTRLVVSVKVAVTFDAGGGDDLDPRLFDLRRTLCRAGENVFDDHS
jgi:hypothetical protein